MILSALVTSGPTIERIDPVRYLTNDSSGKQGYAIAKALADAGVKVTLISGPVHITPPTNVNLIKVESANQMHEASLQALPVDIAVCVAAVADWCVSDIAPQKLKKEPDQNELTLKLVKTPDILASLSTHKKRPKLVIGFAAESENIHENIKKKLASKGCDWIIANDISNNNVFGADDNEVHFVSHNTAQAWPRMAKVDVANNIVKKIEAFLSQEQTQAL